MQPRAHFSIRRHLKENAAHERAKHVLTEWREALDRAAKILLKREVLEGSELRKLIKELGDKDRAVA